MMIYLDVKLLLRTVRWKPFELHSDGLETAPQHNAIDPFLLIFLRCVMLDLVKLLCTICVLFNAGVAVEPLVVPA